MPFSKDDGKRESDKYCSLCYQNGHLNAEGISLSEFKNKCYEGMRRRGIGKIRAKFYAWMVGFSPYWKNKDRT